MTDKEIREQIEILKVPRYKDYTYNTSEKWCKSEDVEIIENKLIQAYQERDNAVYEFAKACCDVFFIGYNQDGLKTMNMLLKQYGITKEI